ncbi:NAD(P)-dependent alcohol dehydrogenase [Rhodospirillum rubrum]|uniref:Zinc-containing alcohol dehydrogenase superfamily n=1 Tax=Rhodospirillum rubrum (strain ATCC 11170 / ATH 1.1.1 / DSM 467 / LMG 4362 / NCIMB 8255 / S1) TaxID=269796 RepID=Q2RXT8_RHORT|nr:NAD(P)-dependent alcohol dehydrogenase [Rhodospirillum rubrum]ABC21057.1 Zinc-containing alcohol dehydrogenase superfamily [Rhodospirillum rubrum ATCC 11170]MBK5952601.1 NAD(P)-dependent alcohol dehydrogenase [Rhodospirillum rubrum]QXG80751.1 NAD(P)-dependent alcohol dehydrogenase [Rhodospirillum rubrum]HAQ01032.1 NAD(P)-dependent alcohol dehydrogenase [Rhodospirillum rubrum]HCF18578.1 NAD(P)-dependent alcohol dehydrogenase [Rhodospirillum rubrum]
MKVTGVVLERQGALSLRDIDIPGTLAPGANEVRIAIKSVGICGSDVHYFKHGRIGDFIVTEPMILGHEASGVVEEIGSAVTHLRVGDRVCMEPGVPDFSSIETLRGMYNLDPSVRFWATPPYHGCLTAEVVHPASLTYRLPDSVSFAEGAMVEPLAIGVYAAAKAQIRPGDIAVVTGAGTIGMMVVFAALAAGCAEVIVSDVAAEKLALLASHPEVTTVDLTRESLADAVAARTDGRGVDVFFEASGSTRPYETMIDLIGRGGRIVLVGMPQEKPQLDVVALQVKEISLTGTFRYANVWDRTLKLLGSGKIDLKPLISATFPFSDSVRAFDRAAQHLPSDVKIQISL